MSITNNSTSIKGQSERKEHSRTIEQVKPWLWVALLLSAIVFIVLTWNVIANGPLLRWDQPLAESLHQYALNSSELEHSLMVFSFYLGRELVAVITAVAVIVFWRKKDWQKLALMLIGVGGGSLIWVGFSFLFGRQRPQFDNPVWHPLPWGGFPSGHALVAVATFSLLAYFLWQRTLSPWKRVLIITVAVIITLLIGYSRLYLGAHYISDIVAGYAFGIFWTALVFLLVKRYIPEAAK